MAPAVSLEPLSDIVLGLAAAVLLLALSLLIERSMAALSNFRRRRREPVLSMLLFQAIQTSPLSLADFRRLGRFDRQMVRSILLGLALDLRGDTGDAIAAAYRELGFLKDDLARLHSWSAGRRAGAAADLGLIQTSDSIPALLRALGDRDVRVRQAAVWAIGQIGEPRCLTGLISLLGDRSLIVAHRAQEVLAERGGEVANDILKYAETTSSRAGRLAAVQLIGWLRITTAADFLQSCMGDLDPEVRVKSVKAAAAIGDPTFLQTFHARLEDVRWEVRCQAAKGLSLFGSPVSVPRLAAALRDQHWWVRFYAATALAEMGPAGEAALSAARHDPEPSVQEMARYLLGRGEVVPVLP